MRPVLILDDALEGRLHVFGAPRRVIEAVNPDDVRPALDALEGARRMGNFIAGYFSYELGYVLESRLVPRLPPRRPVPLLWFALFDPPSVVRGPDIAPALRGWVRGRAYAGPLRHDWDTEAYGRRFERVHDWIAAGDIYQANLTFRSRFSFAGDPLALYAKLRSTSSARYGAYVEDGERTILSLSPELFFTTGADGVITTRPMKGTAARGGDPVSDLLAKQGLAESTKNRAENLMIVDLLRNDLGRIAGTGSVAVPRLFDVETYPTLHQMVSSVTGKLKPGLSVGDLVGALFPCGSVTGAPKIRAMEVIADLEDTPRGLYCGAIGMFAPDGSAAFNVAIRTLTIHGMAGELGIGGGVVQDSDTDGEYDECLLKARYYDIARRPLELIETLRWSPEDGFVRRDLHLARLGRSAVALGLPFDAVKAEGALNAALSSRIHRGGRETSGILRIRLSLNEAGEYAVATAPLPPAKAEWTFALSPHCVLSTDLLARHKTNWRDLYDAEFARLTAQGACDEVVFLNERGEVAEGSRTTVFAHRGGQLLTPALSAGILDGVLRQDLLARGACEEAVLTADDLRGEVYLGNSLRGLIPARLAG